LGFEHEEKNIIPSTIQNTPANGDVGWFVVHAGFGYKGATGAAGHYVDGHL